MSKPLEVGSVARDAPIRLSTAAKLAFPDGTMTASGLRREALRGRLVTERIAGKDFTTLENIDRMREQCRVQAKVPASISVGPDSGDERSSRRPSGSSRMAVDISPRDALQARLKQNRLERPSKR